MELNRRNRVKKRKSNWKRKEKTSPSGQRPPLRLNYQTFLKGSYPSNQTQCFTYVIQMATSVSHVWFSWSCNIFLSKNMLPCESAEDVVSSLCPPADTPPHRKNQKEMINHFSLLCSTLKLRSSIPELGISFTESHLSV